MADFLLELEAVAHRVAGINQQAYLKRQIGLVVKTADCSAGLLSSRTEKSLLARFFT